MKFNLDNPAGHTIIGYDVGEIQVHHDGTPQVEGIEKKARIVRTSAIITPASLVENWPPIVPTDVLPLHMQQVLEFQPEIVILGTGRSLRFPAPEIIQLCHQAGAGFEVMDTGAACRTYNILAAEGRHVAAALLMIEALNE
jgi:uncharacterized protein